MNVKVKEVVKYNGHNVRANGSVDISFKAMYGEITNSISVLQMLNNDVTIAAKLAGQKPKKLGMFRVKNVSFDDDGESVLKFNSITDNVEMDNINEFVTMEEFQILLNSEVEEEEEEEEEEEWNE